MKTFDPNNEGKRRAKDTSAGRRVEASLHHPEHGAALLELAICLPVLVMLFLWSGVYVKALQVRESMAVLSREAANAAFRECVEMDIVGSCLQTVYDRVNQGVQEVLPGAELIVSIYTYDVDPVSGAGTINQRGLKPGATTASGKPTRFSTGYFAAIAGFMPRHERVSTSEIFYRYDPVLPVPFTTNDFYDAAIY